MNSPTSLIVLALKLNRNCLASSCTPPTRTLHSLGLLGAPEVPPPTPRGMLMMKTQVKKRSKKKVKIPLMGTRRAPLEIHPALSPTPPLLQLREVPLAPLRLPQVLLLRMLKLPQLPL